MTDIAQKTIDPLATLREWEDRDEALAGAGYAVEHCIGALGASASGEIARAAIIAYLNFTNRDAEAETVAGHILRPAT